jgi:type IV pilus assembly protein PilE
MKNSSRARGVTLIELLVVMVVVALLAAIAWPSYQNYVMRTHRAAARACLSEMAQFMERYYTTNMTYVGANPALGCETESNLDTKYTFDLNPAPTQRTYRIRAVPLDAQQDRDTQCGTLSLNQAGTRTPNTDGCW